MPRWCSIPISAAFSICALLPPSGCRKPGRGHPEHANADLALTAEPQDARATQYEAQRAAFGGRWGGEDDGQAGL